MMRQQTGVREHFSLRQYDPPRQSSCSGDRFKAILIAAALPSRLTRYRLGFYALSPKSQSVPGRTLAVQNSWCAQNSIRPKTVGRTTIRMVAWRPIKDDNSPNRVSGCKVKSCTTVPGSNNLHRKDLQSLNLH